MGKIKYEKKLFKIFTLIYHIILILSCEYINNIDNNNKTNNKTNNTITIDNKTDIINNSKLDEETNITNKLNLNRIKYIKRPYYHQYVGQIKKYITNEILNRKNSAKNLINKTNLKYNYASFENCDQSDDLSFLGYLKQFYNLILSESPDYMFYGCRWKGKVIYPNSINICIYTENLYPDMNRCDYAMGYPIQNLGDRYIHYSRINLLYYYNNEIKNVRKNTTNIKTKFCGAVISNPLEKLEIFLLKN